MGQRARREYQRGPDTLGEAIIAAYCRAFDTHKGGVRLGRDWPGYERPEWRTQHERLIELRHVFVSHSELASRRVVVKTTETGRLQGA